jgi:hypothetical protein
VRCSAISEEKLIALIQLQKTYAFGLLDIWAAYTISFLVTKNQVIQKNSLNINKISSNQLPLIKHYKED